MDMDVVTPVQKRIVDTITVGQQTSKNRKRVGVGLSSGLASSLIAKEQIAFGLARSCWQKEMKTKAKPERNQNKCRLMVPKTGILYS